MILIIDYLGSFTFNLYQVVAKYAQEVKIVDSRYIDLKDLQKMNPKALFLSSGPGLPKDTPLILEIVKEFAPIIPILGISLGHLAIAEAFGGEIIPVKQIEHGKTGKIYPIQDEIFNGIETPLEGGYFHSFVVSKNSISEDLKLLAVSEQGDVMSIKHAEFPCYGFQFNLESLLTPQGEIIIKNFINSIK